MNDGKACWYRDDKKDSWHVGHLVHWGQNHIEYEEGPGNFTVAVIIDDDTLMAKCIEPKDCICFAAVPPKP